MLSSTLSFPFALVPSPIHKNPSAPWRAGWDALCTNLQQEDSAKDDGGDDEEEDFVRSVWASPPPKETLQISQSTKSRSTEPSTLQRAVSLVDELHVVGDYYSSFDPKEDSHHFFFLETLEETVS